MTPLRKAEEAVEAILIRRIIERKLQGIFRLAKHPAAADAARRQAA